MRLIVIRHGQTTGDVEDRYGGAYDDLLSLEGEAQVENLATELADKSIQHVFCSSLKRAQQTSQGVAAKAGCAITVMDGLKERNQYGPLTGMLKSEAKAKFPAMVEQLKDRLNTLPDAESYAAASTRTSAAFAEVLAHMQAQGQSCAAIVWHGGCMRVLFRDILAFGELTEIGDCCWVELEIDADNLSASKIIAAQRIGFGFEK